MSEWDLLRLVRPVVAAATSCRSRYVVWESAPVCKLFANVLLSQGFVDVGDGLVPQDGLLLAVCSTANFAEGILKQYTHAVVVCDSHISIRGGVAVFPKSSGQGFLLQLLHAALDIAESGRVVCLDTLANQLSSECVCHGGSDDSWFVGGAQLDVQCSLISQGNLGADGKRAGTVLKRWISSAKVKLLLKYFTVVIYEDRNGQHRLSCNSEDEANRVASSVASGTAIEYQHEFWVRCPLRAFLVLELLKEKGTGEPTSGLRIVALDILNESPAPRVDAPPDVVQPLHLPTPSTVDQRPADEGLAARLSKLEEIVVQQAEENKSLREMFQAFEKNTQSEMQALKEEIDGAKAFAADHRLVSEALDEIRRECAPDSASLERSCDRMVESRMARFGDQYATKSSVDTLSTTLAAVQLESQEAQRTLVSLQRGTELAINKLHGEALHQQRISAEKQQGLRYELENDNRTRAAHEFQRIHREVGDQMQKLWAEINQLRSRPAPQSPRRDPQEHTNFAGLEKRVSNNEERLTIVAEHVQRIASKQSQSEAAATPAATPAASVPQASPVASADANETSEALKLMEAKVQRNSTEMKSISDRVHEVEMLQAELSSLLEISSSQEEKLHTLDDRIDDISIKVEALLNRDESDDADLE